MSRHKVISYVKSALRLVGYVALMGNICVGAVILIVAEFLGIEEENEE